MKRKLFSIFKILTIVTLGGFTFAKALENRELSAEYSELKDSYGSVIVSDPTQIYISDASINQSGELESYNGTKLVWQVYCPDGVAIRASHYNCFIGEYKGRNYSLGFVNGTLSDPAKTETVDFYYRPYDVCRGSGGQVKKFIEQNWGELERTYYPFDGRTPIDLSKTVVLFELRVPEHLQVEFEAAIDEYVAEASNKVPIWPNLTKSQIASRMEKQSQEALWQKHLLLTRPVYRFEIEKINAAMVRNRVIPRNSVQLRKAAFQRWLSNQSGTQ